MPGQHTSNNNCNGTNTLPNGGTCVTSSGVTRTMYPGRDDFRQRGVQRRRRGYFPNAEFNASGSSCNSSTPRFGNSSTACLEIIATSILTTGNSNFNSNCTAYGTATFTSTTGTTTRSAQVVH